MARLTDTQLVILSTASRRNDCGVDLPTNVTGEAVRKAVDKLIHTGLLEEVRANGSLLAWRRDAEAGPMALRITKQGLEAIGANDVAVGAETRVSPAPDLIEVEAPAVKVVASRNRISVAAKKQGRKKLACSPCWAGRRERPLPPSCVRPIGSSIRCAASSLAWCAKSSALICARKNPMAMSGSIASPRAAVLVPTPGAVAQLERPCHAW
jgi:hypothetical protein